MKNGFWIILPMAVIVSGGCTTIKYSSDPQSSDNPRNLSQLHFDLRRALKEALVKKDYRFMSVVDSKNSKQYLFGNIDKSTTTRQGYKRIDQQNKYFSGIAHRTDLGDEQLLYNAAMFYNARLFTYLRKTGKAKGSIPGGLDMLPKEGQGTFGW